VFVEVNQHLSLGLYTDGCSSLFWVLHSIEFAFAYRRSVVGWCFEPLLKLQSQNVYTCNNMLRTCYQCLMWGRGK